MHRAWLRELSGWLGALAVAVITAGQLAASARSELLFRDGDSLLVALFARSIVAGDRPDWAMSSVLFLPESAQFLGPSALFRADVNTLLALSAVVNLLALYGALRLAAGRRSPDTAPVLWSLCALLAFGALVATEMSPSRDALELASLLGTTTYYSATVVAVVLTIGLIRRALERPGWGVVAALGAVSTLSTLSNPLYAAWGAVPTGAVLLGLAVRSGARARMLMLAGVLVGGAVLGAVCRIPFAAWIANTGAGYAQPELWRESLTYYAGLLGDRLATPLGLVACIVVLALMALGVFRTLSSQTVAERAVALCSWVIPVIVIVGAIVLGTHAARYLQPAVFAPLLALLVTPRPIRISFGARRAVAAAAAALLLVGGAVSVPRLSAAAHAADDDLDCVTDWVDASGRVGAGQFWTVRLPKLHLADPAQLVQVDHRLDAYAWLVNRTDFEVSEVSFLIEDAQTVPWELPESAVPERVVPCGRYSILDFGGDTLALGPMHS